MFEIQYFIDFVLRHKSKSSRTMERKKKSGKMATSYDFQSLQRGTKYFIDIATIGKTGEGRTNEIKISENGWKC